MNVHTSFAQDFKRIAAFYRDDHYGQDIYPEDSFVIAEDDGSLYGVVRLCQEHGVLVLRGMRVRKGKQRQGIGTALLEALEPLIGDRECFCIPYSHLRSFYGQIGFVEIASNEAPPFLQERLHIYRSRLGLDAILMHRPASPSS